MLAKIHTLTITSERKTIQFITLFFGKLEGTFRIYQSRKNIRKVVMLEVKGRRDRELYIPRIVFDIHYSERLSIGKESLID